MKGDTYMFLYLEFLETYKLRAASLDVETTSRLVGDTVLAGAGQ